ncbi:MAG TPA: class I SAM-dependent RNA methyltransferase [Candidatus Krumholzibacteria bacterium]|nr:class I SAM-dependent RNA methyltransferase [Candidatus Krumholzibacteria bacterium]HPD70428.1 class I SAM-dependent RNA methyltransferase [Candidatus Krumholzibacteria bacterium]HRY39872.1 class I SAM-dependent RNA methyltransferase [Candidatus Krumholzibacteria bacterium]
MDKPAETTIELVIDKLVTGGRGLGRHEGQAIFVPRTAPGDRVRVRPSRSHKGYREADLLEVLAAGPGRHPAPCPHYERCGGCDLQHLDEQTQAAARRDILLDCLGRLGNLDVSGCLDEADAGPAFGYRNRLRLTAHPTGPYGLKRSGTREVVPLDVCPIMAPPFTETVLPWLRFLPPVDQIVVRLDGRGGWLVSLYGPVARQRALKRLLAETPDGGEPVAGLQGVLLNNRPQWGRMYLILHVAGHKFRVSHQSFFQGNLAAAEAALRTVRSWLEADHPAGGDLADLYGGVGLFTLGLADRFDRILCVDSDPSAALDARENVRREPAARDKAVIREGAVQAVLADPDVRASLAWERACVVVDPPRAGLGKPVLAALAEIRPRSVMYLSCDPATLARDCAALVAGGYQVRRVRPVAMFPQSSHVETLVHLARESLEYPGRLS